MTVQLSVFGLKPTLQLFNNLVFLADAPDKIAAAGRSLQLSAKKTQPIALS